MLVAADTFRGAAVEHAQRVLRQKNDLDIEASDTDPRALQAVRENLRAAGLDGVVRVVHRQAQALPPVQGGVIIGNPPYGIRLNDADVLALYREIGERWQACQDATVAILCGNVDFVANFGWPVASARELRNGPIEVGLFKYHR